MKYILKLQSDNSWILGTVHSSAHKPDAEKNALESLAIHIRTKVRTETDRKIEELISIKMTKLNKIISPLVSYILKI